MISDVNLVNSFIKNQKSR